MAISRTYVAPPPGSSRNGIAPPDGVPAEVIIAARNLNSEAIHLRNRAEEVQQGKVSLEEYATVFQQTQEDMERYLGEIEGDDLVVNLQNLWETLNAVQVFVSPGGDYTPKEEREGLDRLIKLCRSITLATMHLTVTNRLMDWLDRLEGEYVLDFNMTFLDEIPDEEDRKYLLNWLAAAPNTFTNAGGLIEPDTGLIYKTFTDSAQRRRREIFLLLIFLLSFVVVSLASALNVWPRSFTWALAVTGWVAALVGLLVHFVVASHKRVQAGYLNGAFPLERVRLMLSARAGALLLRFLGVLIAYFGATFLLGSEVGAENTVFLFNAFLVGYSTDSILEILTGTLDEKAVVLSQRLSG